MSLARGLDPRAEDDVGSKGIVSERKKQRERYLPTS